MASAGNTWPSTSAAPGSCARGRSSGTRLLCKSRDVLRHSGTELPRLRRVQGVAHQADSGPDCPSDGCSFVRYKVAANVSCLRACCCARLPAPHVHGPTRWGGWAGPRNRPGYDTRIMIQIPNLRKKPRNADMAAADKRRKGLSTGRERAQANVLASSPEVAREMQKSMAPSSVQRLVPATLGPLATRQQHAKAAQRAQPGRAARLRCRAVASASAPAKADRLTAAFQAAVQRKQCEPNCSFLP